MIHVIGSIYQTEHEESQKHGKDGEGCASRMVHFNQKWIGKFLIFVEQIHNPNKVRNGERSDDSKMDGPLVVQVILRASRLEKFVSHR